jgi:hypothetical protein
MTLSFRLWLLSAFVLVACGGGGSGGSGPQPSLAPDDPSGVAKCKVAVNQESPLVTEWPASEKARLEALVAKQVVAVEYSGCEMKVVEGCSIPGSYGWKQTTLATDTVEIADADELYAKLPLGAIGLEGQLQRSGRLAIRTTVAGQLEIQQVPATDLPNDGACTNVTHFVKSITVGSFRLVSGGAVAGSGSVGVGPVGAGVGSSREESLLREAGNPIHCGEATDTAPHPQCASPIQVFLSPVRRTLTGEARVAEMDELRARELGGAYITFPEREDEHWSLRNPNGNVICEVPCSRWVPPGSGYFLERSRDSAKVKVSDRFGTAPGAHATAEYNPDKGYPFWAALTFYGMGVPCAIGGTIVLILGLTEEEEDRADGIDRSNKGFYFSSAALFLSMSAASALWYFVFTDWESFEVRSNGKAGAREVRKNTAQQKPSGLQWVPGTLGARF